MQLHASAGLSWELEACNRTLQEGLVVFCPELAASSALEDLMRSTQEQSTVAPEVSYQTVPLHESEM